MPTAQDKPLAISTTTHHNLIPAKLGRKVRVGGNVNPIGIVPSARGKRRASGFRDKLKFVCGLYYHRRESCLSNRLENPPYLVTIGTDSHALSRCVACD